MVSAWWLPTIYNSSCRGSETFSWSLQALGMHVVCIHNYKHSHTLIFIIKNIYLKKITEQQYKHWVLWFWWTLYFLNSLFSKISSSVKWNKDPIQISAAQIWLKCWCSWRQENGPLHLKCFTCASMLADKIMWDLVRSSSDYLQMNPILCYTHL